MLNPHGTQPTESRAGEEVTHHVTGSDSRPRPRPGKGKCLRTLGMLSGHDGASPRPRKQKSGRMAQAQSCSLDQTGNDGRGSAPPSELSHSAQFFIGVYASLVSCLDCALPKVLSTHWAVSKNWHFTARPDFCPRLGRCNKRVYLCLSLLLLYNTDEHAVHSFLHLPDACYPSLA